MIKEDVETTCTCSTIPGVALELCPRPGTEPRERMPGKVAHDLLGVVTIIRGYADLVAAEPSNTLKEEYCLRIRRACGRVVDMVDSALRLGEQASGVPVLKMKQVELDAFLADCIAEQELKARRKGTLLRLETSSANSTVSIDPGAVERITSNLLENAIKFSRAPATITLRGSVHRSSLVIEVQDDGPGIPTWEIPALFDAHRTGSARPTGGERSTGLGLSIVKELVEAHHGEVVVRSEVGHGSTFSVHLPLAPPERLARAGHEASHNCVIRPPAQPSVSCA